MPEIGEHSAGPTEIGERDAGAGDGSLRGGGNGSLRGRVCARAHARTHTRAHSQPNDNQPHTTPAGATGGAGSAGKRPRQAPWVIALAVAAPLALAYLLARPPSGDLATATYRGELFGRVGLTLWDDGWYGGHYMPGYSLLSPALGWLVGERLLLALSVVAAATLFGMLVRGAFGPAGSRVAAASFALGISVELLSGRVAYDLGLALGLLALLALRRGWAGTASALALLTSLASPVAGAFLALAGLAYALANFELKGPAAAAPAPAPIAARAVGPSKATRDALRVGALNGSGVVVAAAALAPIVVLAVLFPEGGWEPFAPSVFWPGLAGAVAIALLLPRLGARLAPPTRRMLAWGTWLYAAALIGSFVLHTPVGSNAARLGELVAAPLVAGALWERQRLALALLAPALLYWQLETPIGDVSELLGDPSVNAAYYAPLVRELQSRANGVPLRVEVPQTGAHWESVYLPEQGPIVLARGWERQLDTRYAALFYGARLTPAAYRAWLAENAVAYVALPDVRLDFSGEQEGRLITHGLPYLREVWRGAHWRLFAVRDATPLAQRPAVVRQLGFDSFTVTTPRAGTFTLRVRFTPYWALSSGRGCVQQAPAGWTALRAQTAGTFRVDVDFAAGRIFDHGPRCRG